MLSVCFGISFHSAGMESVSESKTADCKSSELKWISLKGCCLKEFFNFNSCSVDVLDGQQNNLLGEATQELDI